MTGKQNKKAPAADSYTISPLSRWEWAVTTKVENSSQRLVLTVLSERADKDTLKVTLLLETIVKRTLLSRATVCRALDRLVALNLIRRLYRHRHASQFILTPFASHGETQKQNLASQSETLPSHGETLPSHGETPIQVSNPGVISGTPLTPQEGETAKFSKKEGEKGQAGPRIPDEVLDPKPRARTRRYRAGEKPKTLAEEQQEIQEQWERIESYVPPDPQTLASMKPGMNYAVTSPAEGAPLLTRGQAQKQALLKSDVQAFIRDFNMTEAQAQALVYEQGGKQ